LRAFCTPISTNHGLKGAKSEARFSDRRSHHLDLPQVASAVGFKSAPERSNYRIFLSRSANWGRPLLLDVHSPRPVELLF
jgi:hypothetical protein